MEESLHTVQIVFLLLSSLILLLLLIHVLTILLHRRRKRSNLLYWVLLLFGAILLLQLSYLIGMVGSGQEDELKSGYELAVRLIAQSFQMFTLDADYAEILNAGRASFAFSSFCAVWYSLMTIALTFVAPLIGGFIIARYFLDSFPRLQFHCFFWRDKIIFSELNEHSIEIAENIFRLEADGRMGEWRWLKHAKMIFTDVYENAAAEKNSELLDRAYRIGAICLKQDFLEDPYFLAKFSGRRVYFAVDADEKENFLTAVTLLSENGAGRIVKKNAWRRHQVFALYAFLRDRDGEETISGKYEKFRSFKEVQEATGLVSHCVVINDCRAEIYHLLDGFDREPHEAQEKAAQQSYPLYWRYLFEEDVPDISSLSVLVIGDGPFAKQFIRTAYWIGQMLNPKTVTDYGRQKNQKTEQENYENIRRAATELRLTVISENAKSLETYFRYAMPEAFDEKAKDYCTLRFYASAAEKRKGALSLDERIRRCKADYVMIDLGDDGRTFSVANYVKRIIDTKYVDRRNIPVTFAIENSAFAEEINNAGRNASDRCFLYAFGSLKSRYDFFHIFQPQMEKDALSVHRTHESPEKIYSNYDRKSSLASALHLSYKFLSLNLIPREHLQRLLKLSLIYQCKENRNLFDNLSLKCHLYWLEHRRWCAYMRSEGYICPTVKEVFDPIFMETAEKDDFAEELKKQKKALQRHRLHCCLLEGRFLNEDVQEPSDLFATFQAAYRAKDREDDLERFLTGLTRPESGMDALDIFSFLSNNNYKSYDINVVREIFDSHTKAYLLQNVEQSWLKNISVDILESIVQTNQPLYIGCSLDTRYVFWLLRIPKEKKIREIRTVPRIPSHRHSRIPGYLCVKLPAAPVPAPKASDDPSAKDQKHEAKLDATDPKRYILEAEGYTITITFEELRYGKNQIQKN